MSLVPRAIDDMRPAAIGASVLRAISERRPIVFEILVVMTIIDMMVGTVHLPYAIRIAVTALAPVSLIIPNRQIGHLIFSAIAALLVYSLINDYYLMANHGFIITYFAVLLVMIWRHRDSYWQHAEFFSRVMLATLMGAALLHKLTSLHYMSGNLMADLILGGQAYTNLLPLLYSDAHSVIAQSVQSKHALINDYDLLKQSGSVPLPSIGLALTALLYAMTYISVLMQGLLEAALIFQRLFGIWLHRLIFLFVLVVYSLRPENVFLSLNCIMGYALTDARSAKMRLPYVALIAYLLVSSLIGFRPAIAQ